MRIAINLYVVDQAVSINGVAHGETVDLKLEESRAE